MQPGGEERSFSDHDEKKYGRRKIVSGLKWTSLQSWGSQLLSLVTFVLLARLLDPSAFGLLAMANVYIHISGIFVDQGLGTAVVQRGRLESLHVDTAFWMNIGMGLVLMGLGISLSGPIASFYGEPGLKLVIQTLSVNFVLISLVTIQSALLQRKFKFRLLAIRSLLSVGVGGAVGVILALWGFGVMSLVGQQLTISAVAVVTLWAVTGWYPRFRFSGKHCRELVGFSSNIVGARIVNVFTKRSDDLLIGYFLGSVALGYYSIGYKIIRIVLDVFTKILSRVALPSFASLQNVPSSLRTEFGNWIKMGSLLSFPSFVALAFLAPEIVAVLFGAQWMPSVPVLQVLAPLGALQGLVILTHKLFAGAGRPSYIMIYQAVLAPLCVVGFFLAVEYGIVVVAAAYTVITFCLVPLLLWLAYRLVGLRAGHVSTSLRVPFLASGSLALAVLILRIVLGPILVDWQFLTIATLIGTITYGMAVFRLEPSSRAMLRNFIGRLRRSPRSRPRLSAERAGQGKDEAHGPSGDPVNRIENEPGEVPN